MTEVATVRRLDQLAGGIGQRAVDERLNGEADGRQAGERRAGCEGTAGRVHRIVRERTGGNVDCLRIRPRRVERHDAPAVGEQGADRVGIVRAQNVGDVGRPRVLEGNDVRFPAQVEARDARRRREVRTRRGGLAFFTVIRREDGRIARTELAELALERGNRRRLAGRVDERMLARERQDPVGAGKRGLFQHELVDNRRLLQRHRDRLFGIQRAGRVDTRQDLAKAVDSRANRRARGAEVRCVHARVRIDRAIREVDQRSCVLGERVTGQHVDHRRAARQTATRE